MTQAQKGQKGSVDSKTAERLIKELEERKQLEANIFSLLKPGTIKLRHEERSFLGLAKKDLYEFESSKAFSEGVQAFISHNSGRLQLVADKISTQSEKEKGSAYICAEFIKYFFNSGATKVMLDLNYNKVLENGKPVATEFGELKQMFLDGINSKLAKFGRKLDPANPFEYVEEKGKETLVCRTVPK